MQWNNDSGGCCTNWWQFSSILGEGCSFETIRFWRMAHGVGWTDHTPFVSNLLEFSQQPCFEHRKLLMENSTEDFLWGKFCEVYS
jgi:hypothetical protein